jgi:RND family efflux transporter MFP subunit
MAALLLLAAGAARAATPTGFDGLIEPSQMLEIRSPVSGLIAQVHVARGGVVKKGAPLVSLDTSVERAAAELARYKSAMEGAVKASESRLQHAERKLKRRTELAEKNYGTAQEREDAEAEQRIAQADLQQAREGRQLARLELEHANALAGQKQLRSPIDGVVVEQGQWPGEMAEPGDARKPILRIAQIHPLRVSLLLPAALYPKIKAGMKAEVLPEKPMEGRFASTVSMVDKVIDAASGTFRVHLLLPNADGRLPGGLKCKVMFADL